MLKLRALPIAALFLAPTLHAADRPPLKVCLVSGSAEYESEKTLPPFKEHLESAYNVKATLLQAVGFAELPGLSALETCDVALFFTRRLTISGEDLERVKRYCQAGRPVVAVRTASHGFQNWLALDKEVLGGNYHGHFGAGPTVEARAEPVAKGHPVLEGLTTLRSRGSLYRTSPLAADSHVLLRGSFPGCPEPEPAAWTREQRGGRVFYTSLGAQGDFENDSFRRLLANALFWTAGREVERREPPTSKPQASRPAGMLQLHLRTRFEPWKGAGVREAFLEEKVPAAESAIVICDMWDQHWCRGATERCDALAAKMAPVVDAARAKGVRIIHCPSDTMGFYADRPQRRRMQAVPSAAPPALLDLKDPPLPIDDSDGGCDTAEKPWYGAWTRQSPRIAIAPEDGISDSGTEVYNLLRAESLKTVFVMGVHTNMCVLGRSFAIRQLTRLGIRCILVRDLTDTMYDPKDPPHVSHERGTELVVAHIERYWCPSITSRELTGPAEP
jgi:nicotinamidase-related amidase/type 1 glutamine amidotransferase